MNKKNKKNKKKTRKNGMRKKNKTKIRSRVGNSTFIDKSKLITIDIFDSTGDVGGKLLLIQKTSKLVFSSALTHVFT